MCGSTRAVEKHGDASVTHRRWGGCHRGGSIPEEGPTAPVAPFWTMSEQELCHWPVFTNDTWHVRSTIYEANSIGRALSLRRVGSRMRMRMRRRTEADSAEQVGVVLVHRAVPALVFELVLTLCTFRRIILYREYIWTYGYTYCTTHGYRFL